MYVCVCRCYYCSSTGAREGVVETVSSQELRDLVAKRKTRHYMHQVWALKHSIQLLRQATPTQ